MEPSMTSVIALSVMNKNVMHDDLVSTVYFDYNELKSYQAEQMEALGMRVPKVVGNAGVRAAAYRPQKRSLIKRVFGWEFTCHVVGVLSRDVMDDLAFVRLGKPKPPKDDKKSKASDKKVAKLGVGPVWVPLYGAPPMNRSMAQSVGESLHDERNAMNNHPEIASFYR
jgi:hypothetical protein